MAATPRVVVAFRPTEWEHLLDRHATAGQARFFLQTRDRDVEEVLFRHQQQREAITQVERAIPQTWRRTQISRADFAGFLFEPEDIVVAVGQDGLVPNLAKYLSGQPVVGVNPDASRFEGVLVRFTPEQVREVLNAITEDDAPIEERTMVNAYLDDGQQLSALNEIFVGHRSHQSARYLLKSGEDTERQSSSGLIIATGTGSTGWARSISIERQSTLPLPLPTERRLSFFVREAWPSVVTGNRLTQGSLQGSGQLVIVSEMSEGVAFGDGIEADRLGFDWGQTITVGLAPQVLRLVTP